MSRIGRKLVTVPKGVQLERQGALLRVKGPKGTLSQSVPRGIEVNVSGEEVRITRGDERKPTKALHGLTRALLANMLKGVTEGFVRELEIEGVGYRAETDGKK